MTQYEQTPLSAKPFHNSLFADHYLLNIMPDLPEWIALDSQRCFEQIKDLRAKIHPETLNEAQLEEQWVQPILHFLGHHYAVQVKIRYRDQGYRAPDYVFVTSDAEAHAMSNEIYEPQAISHVLAVGDAKRWGSKLDQAAPNQRNPSQQIDEYLRYSERPWGILTDGRIWRLYHRDSSKYNTYYAIDLDALLGGSQENFGYFYAFFRREAFTTGWLNRVLEGSEAFAQRLSDKLEGEVFDALELIAQGFLDYRRNRLTRANLKQIYEQSLVLLYRLLFTFYAESHEVLPVDNEQYRRLMSMDSIKNEIRNDIHFHKAFSRDNGHYYTRLADLFFAIDSGSRDYDVPPYNGRLFSDSEHPFLGENSVGDLYLAPALDKLARVDDNGSRVFVDYRDLDVRHLGSIYERLLEYELDIAREPLKIVGREERYAPAEPGDAIVKEQGQVYLRTGNNERKVTGSYYTPDYIVRFIVEKTLEPLLTAIIARYADADAEGHWHMRDSEALVREVLALNILDPATGSGHFVVDATAYIAEKLRDLGMRPADLGDEDELVYWKRQVASACIYAVDINPLAVELAKLSMWLTTLAKGKPLSFLDHHIRVGNSLVGTKMSAIDDSAVAVKEEEKRRKNTAKKQKLEAATGQINMFSDADFSAGISAAVQQMSAIENTIADDVSDVKKQEQLYADLTQRLSAWKQAADVWTARYFGLELTAEQWKTVREMTTNGAVSPAVQKILDQAARIAEAQKFFHWELAFPEIFYDASGQPKATPGFDVVVGNPPYVRQESIKQLKYYLQTQYKAVYDGSADIYVYFYVRGLENARPDGLLSYITPNKWFSTGYGEGLRGYLAEHTHVQQIVDFGHAPIFRGVDTFPMIGVLSKKDNAPAEAETIICDFPREELVAMLKQASETGSVDLNRYVGLNSIHVPTNRFSSKSWSLEPIDVDLLMQKIWKTGIPLNKFANVAPVYGIKTGFNEAFLINNDIKTALIKADPNCADVIKPYLRGEDIKRWLPEWDEQWMILLYSSGNFTWPWADAGEEAETAFAEIYPSLYNHIKQHEDKVRARANQGRYWWELGAIPNIYRQPKLIYQEIQFHPQYCYDDKGYYANNKCFVLPTDDYYVLAILNSPLIWWHNYRYLTHMKDEALTPAGEKMVNLPIALPSEEIRNEITLDVKTQLDLIPRMRNSAQEMWSWLKMEFGINKLGNKLQAFSTLTEDAFLEEVRRRSAERLTPASLKLLREQFVEYSSAIRSIETERTQIEHRLSDLVNQAYELTADEIDLMWRTAPPRMPIKKSSINN